jgi:hypothetical protein
MLWLLYPILFSALALPHSGQRPSPSFPPIVVLIPPPPPPARTVFPLDYDYNYDYDDRD